MVGLVLIVIALQLLTIAMVSVMTTDRPSPPVVARETPETSDAPEPYREHVFHLMAPNGQIRHEMVTHAAEPPASLTYGDVTYEPAPFIKKRDGVWLYWEAR